MKYGIQKAGTGKRIAAFLFDFIVFSVVAAGFAFLVSLITGYDAHQSRLEEIYAGYESEWGVSFEMTEEEYGALDEAGRDNYRRAVEALEADPDAARALSATANLSLVITSVSLLLAFIGLEFVLPSVLGEGQTLGKKIFGIGVIRSDGVRASRVQLFIRAILGKYTVETMLPVLLFLLFLFMGLGILYALAVTAALGIAQAVSFFSTRNRLALHDLLAGTVAVDLQTQYVFADEREAEEKRAENVE